MIFRDKLLGIILCGWSAIAFGNDDSLAKIAQNPVSDVVTVPFQNNTNFNYGLYHRTQDILNIQPVIPIAINSQLNLITRTILPVMHQPELFRRYGIHNGIGDLNPTFLFTPLLSKKVIWGLGPTFLIPTASQSPLGTGKWGIGPAGVFVINSGQWVVGAITNNIWSFAGQDNRPSVNLLTFQYFINYNLRKGWYLVSAPIINANWQVASKERWTIPFGAGVGRAFKMGNQPMNINLQYFYNVKNPEFIGPESSVRCTVQFLFTKET